MDWGVDGHRVLSGSGDGWVKCWDLRQMKETGGIDFANVAVEDHHVAPCPQIPDTSDTVESTTSHKRAITALMDTGCCLVPAMDGSNAGTCDR
jgi:hypothetical protein